MFEYKNNKLFLSGKKDLLIEDLVKNKDQAFYLYDKEGLKDFLQFFLKEVDMDVFFAMKANSNLKLLESFKNLGTGVDVVSMGEAKEAMKVGFKGEDIVFSGVGKTKKELEEACKENFFQINVESLPELKKLNEVAKNLNHKARIGLRINPDVDFESHPYIKTGLSGHKFGFEEEEIPALLEALKDLKNLHLQGLSMHIGSQILDLSPFYEALRKFRKLFEDLKEKVPSLSVLDIGGGIGVNYESRDLETEKKLVKEFGKNSKEIFKDFQGKIICEPGRVLCAKFGMLLAKILYIKKSPSKEFIILNSGMNHFLRPALYGAKHQILALKKDKPLKNYDVVGPICETGDTFLKECPLPSSLKEGDWLGIADTGAYGFVMANHYNKHDLPKEIVFDEGKQV